MARLVVRFGDKTQQIVNLDLPMVTIGRGSGAQIVVDDPLVSREHCRIRLMGDGHLIIDLESRTGTFVNGEKVAGSQILEHGDEVGVGKHTVLYEYGEARTKAKPKADEKKDTGEFWLSSLQDQSPFAEADDKKKVDDIITAGSTPALDASELKKPENQSMQDYQGTMVASAGELQRARQLALLMQKPHVKFRRDREAHTAPVGDGFEVGYTEAANVRLEGSRLFGKRQFRIEASDGGAEIQILSFWAKVEVNGKRVRGRNPLKDGARIKAGGKTFQFGAGDAS